MKEQPPTSKVNNSLRVFNSCHSCTLSLWLNNCGSSLPKINFSVNPDRSTLENRLAFNCGNTDGNVVVSDILWMLSKWLCNLEPIQFSAQFPQSMKTAIPVKFSKPWSLRPFLFIHFCQVPRNTHDAYITSFKWENSNKQRRPKRGEHTELQRDLLLPSATMQLVQPLFPCVLVKSIQSIGIHNKPPFLLPPVQLRTAAIADVSWPML